MQEIETGNFAIPRWALCPPSSVRVVNWNINRGLQLQRVIEFLASTKADIMLAGDFNLDVSGSTAAAAISRAHFQDAFAKSARTDDTALVLGAGASYRLDLYARAHSRQLWHNHWLPGGAEEPFFTWASGRIHSRFCHGRRRLDLRSPGVHLDRTLLESVLEAAKQFVQVLCAGARYKYGRGGDRVNLR